jgi:methylphosphotriester-DNA--protein-cysteine methyltransferase
MRLLREHPEYGIVTVSQDAGFNSVRTFQRKMNEAVGMTPVEFRMLVEKEH